MLICCHLKLFGVYLRSTCPADAYANNDVSRGASIVIGDFTVESVQSAVLKHCRKRALDVVLSDMAHSFIGNQEIDHLKQMGLAESALAFAKENLRLGGSFVVKVRHGKEMREFSTALNQCFQLVHLCKPESSRKESAEMYFVCKGYLHPDR